MASLVRPSYTVHVDAAGQRVPKGTPGAKRVRRRASKWYGQNLPGQPPRKRVPLATDKRVAREMLAELVARGARGLVGLPDADALSKPIAEHVEAYRRHTAAGDAVPKYVATTAHRVTRAAAAAGFATAGDLLAAGARLRLHRAVNDMPDLGDQTKAHYLTSFASFARWLHEEAEVLPRNPMAGRRAKRGGKGSRRIRQVRGRRPLAADELARLIEAAAASTTTRRGLDGPARAALYATAAGTGLRAYELYSLTPASFALAADPPTVFVSGEHTKNGEDATIPLPPGVAALLARFLPTRPTSGRVWPGGWRDKAAGVVAADLKAAGIPYRVETADGPRLADFHSLRHYYVTAVVAGGAGVKEAQVLARHANPAMTIGTYSHTTPKRLAAAVAAIPVAADQAPAAGPFAALSRADLERLAEWAIVTLGAVLLAPLLAPLSETAGDDGRHADTIRPDVPLRKSHRKRRHDSDLRQTETT